MTRRPQRLLLVAALCVSPSTRSPAQAIAKAYYERATDQRQAVYDLLHIRDYDALLEASGYAKRMER